MPGATNALGTEQVVTVANVSAKRRAVSRRQLALADGATLTQHGAAPRLAGFLVMFAIAQLFDEAAALEQLFEAAQGRTDMFAIVDTHPQRHKLSFSGVRSQEPGVKTLPDS